MSVLSTALAYWQARNYSGAGDWLDEGVNGLDLTPTGGPTFVPLGGLSYWDLAAGQDLRRSVDDAVLDFGNTSDFSVAFSGQQTPALGSNAVMMGKRNSLTSGDKGYMLWGLNDGRAFATVDDGTAQDQADRSGMVVDTDYVAGFSHDGSGAGTLTGYVNAVPSTPIALTTTTDYNTTIPFMVGVRGFGSGNDWIGRLYTVAVFNKVLTQQDWDDLQNEMSPSVDDQLLMMGV